jgi:secondary thiamine-phosphate synthase enzyme
MKKIKVKTRSRIEMVDVTAEVARAVSESGINEGICVVYCPHTTAGVVINEHADPAVAEDIMSALSEEYPHRRAWKHMEGNADAHTKAAVLGNSATIPVSEGMLALGTWQGIFFCECDGPRSRELYIQTVSGK